MKSIVFFITPLIVARAYTLFVGLSEFPSAGMLLHMSRGLLSDIAVGALAGFILKPVFRKKAIYYAVWTLWVLFFSLNIEHVKVNSANASYSFAHLALTEDFIMGSVLTLTNLSTFIICIGLSVGVLGLLSKWNFQFYHQKIPHQLIIVLPLVVSIALIPTSRLHPYWAQMNIIEENLKDMLKKPVYRSDVQVDMAVMEKFRKRDLSGKKLFPYPDGRPNILIILIEGLGHRAIESDYMPYLRKLLDENLSYKTFIAQQRQTNRGLYALLCGDLPNFITPVAKADIIGQHGPLQACLPEVLRGNGYHTIFMQSADLGYMRKDILAEKMGFSDILGRNQYEMFIRKTAWGVDDKSLYLNAFQKIKQLPENIPWLMTLLTTGTHPPYNVPETSSPTLEQAFLYADDALKEFMYAMALNGTLKNTLVIISSDESHFSEGEGVLGEASGNHLPLVLIAPDVTKPLTASEPFMQADIPLSIADYLNLAPHEFVGRSIFRTYKDRRHLIFGNAYTSRIYNFTPDNRLYVCTKELECSSLASLDGDLFGNSYADRTIDPDQIMNLKMFLSYNELSYDKLTTNIIFREEGKSYVGSRLLLGDYKLSADKGDSIIWRLKIRAEDEINIGLFAAIDKFAEKDPKRIIFRKRVKVADDTFLFEHEFRANNDIPLIWTNVVVDTAENGKYHVTFFEIERLRGKRH
jgi:hypothetical protein